MAKIHPPVMPAAQAAAPTATAPQTEAIAPVTDPAAAALAALAGDDTSLAGMSQHMIIPRLKIVQSSSADDLKAAFGEGAAIIRPGDALVAKPNTPFLFVPLFFFTEYCLWNDIKDTEKSGIQDRSFDDASDLAKRCKDKNLRSVCYPGHENRPEKDRWYKHYVQHLCFPGTLYGDHHLSGIPVVLSFERGEFFQGKSFISAIQLRRETMDTPTGPQRKCPPLWAQLWELTPAKGDQRKANGGSWWGFNFRSIGLVDPSKFADFKAQHLELAQAHQNNLLRVDHGNDGGEDAAAAAPAGKQGDANVPF